MKSLLMALTGAGITLAVTVYLTVYATNATKINTGCDLLCIPILIGGVVLLVNGVQKNNEEHK